MTADHTASIGYLYGPAAAQYKGEFLGVLMLLLYICLGSIGYERHCRQGRKHLMYFVQGVVMTLRLVACPYVRHAALARTMPASAEIPRSRPVFGASSLSAVHRHAARLDTYSGTIA